MRWRIVLILALTMFCSISGAISPYWDSVMKPKDSWEGRTALKERAQDAPGKVIGRAAMGAAIGFVAGLLSLTIRTSRDYRDDPDRKLHWTGLEIRRRKPPGGDSAAG